jgi:hypothetical protein
MMLAYCRRTGLPVDAIIVVEKIGADCAYAGATNSGMTLDIVT